MSVPAYFLKPKINGHADYKLAETIRVFHHNKKGKLNEGEVVPKSEFLEAYKRAVERAPYGIGIEFKDASNNEISSWYALSNGIDGNGVTLHVL